MKAGMQEARIRLIYAPGDGIEPAALLQVADNGPQVGWISMNASLRSAD